MRESYYIEKIDSKAYFVQLIKKLPIILLMGVAGAVLGSGLYLGIILYNYQETTYEKTAEYYIDFADGRLEAKDYYNDFTWNDVMKSDQIIGEAVDRLGDRYERKELEEMITADILSDVRYLTITITDDDMEKVEEVSSTIETVLEEFATLKDEFDHISLIRNDDVKELMPSFFTWRAATLGFILSCGLSVAVFSIKFGVGDSLYTKKDIMKYLGIPALGIWYKNGCRRDGAQERQFDLAIDHLANAADKNTTNEIVCVDIDEKHYSKKFVKEYNDLFIEEYDNEEPFYKLVSMKYPRKNADSYNRIRESKGVVIVIPFGKHSRQNAEDTINELLIQDCEILGAVLVDVNRKWFKRYTGRKG